MAVFLNLVVEQEQQVARSFRTNVRQSAYKSVEVATGVWRED